MGKGKKVFISAVLSLTACPSAPTMYDVIFNNYDGSELYTSRVQKGQEAVYNGDTPTREKTAQYTYVYSGWDKPTANIQEDTTFTAQYVSVTNTYTITWVNEDNTVLKNDNQVPYGTTPSYSGTPTKPATDAFSYVFSEWQPAVAPVTGNQTNKAVYTSHIHQYTVTFLNWDESPLGTNVVNHGGTAVYPGSVDPVRQPSAQYSYSFAGWDHALTNVTSSFSTIAKYDTTTNQYTVTFLNWDASRLGESIVDYGGTATYPLSDLPTKPATAKYTYAFNGWDDVLTNVTHSYSVTAEFVGTINSYDITWKNGDTVLYSEKIAYGQTPSYNGDDPVKANNAQYSYAWTGWSPSVTSVTGDATYSATYSENVNKYKVVWKDENGNILETDNQVPYDTTPTFNSDLPTKDPTDQYTYTCGGWSPEVTSVTGDAIYIAYMNQTVNEYTVEYRNYDNSLLDSYSVAYGTVPSYSGTTPLKPSTTQYSYTFSSWSPTEVAVTGRASYTANFTETLNKYTVTFLDYDGETLDTQDIEYGSDCTYAGETPTRASDPQYTYSFSGWDKTITNITGNVSTVAQYDKTVNEYTVTWKNENGDILETDENVPYGTTPTFDDNTPTKGGNAQYSYVFAGWSPSVVSVTGNVTYTATYSQVTNKYDIIWKNDDGTIIKTDNLAYGEMPSYEGDTPTKASDVQHTYTFSSWSPEIVSVTGEAIYTAVYSVMTRSYDITWKNDNSSTLKVDSVEYGQTPSYTGDTPTKNYTADNLHFYEFSGWTPALASVSGEATYTATYELKTILNYSLTADETAYYVNGFNVECETYEIPASYNGLPVTFIDSLKDNQTLKYLIIPSTITGISYKAFSNCPSLDYLYIPSSVTDISNDIFYGYTSISGVYCGASSRPDGWSTSAWNYDTDNTFWGISGMSLTEDGFLFTFTGSAGSYAAQIIAWWGTGSIIAIPETILYGELTMNVNSLGRNLFNTTITADYLIIPDTILYISSQISEVYYLCEVIVCCEATSKPDGWTTNWSGNPDGFEDTATVEPLWGYVSSGVTEDGLQYVVCLDGDGYQYISIVGYVGESLNVTIPNYITIGSDAIVVRQIHAYAFHNNGDIMSVSIPSNLLSIGSFAFYDCIALNSVTLSEGLLSIGIHSFEGCEMLKSISLPDSLTSIGKRAFAYCVNMTSIVIPAAVTTIGKEMITTYNEDPNSYVIYCVATEAGEGWDAEFYPTSYTNITVYYGYTGSGTTEDGFVYQLVTDGEGNKYISITGYTGEVSNSGITGSHDYIKFLSIPRAIVSGGIEYPVKKVAVSAFSDIDIRGMYIPSTVTMIENSGTPFNCNYFYCESASQPTGWDSGWSYTNVYIIWGYISKGTTEDGYTYDICVDSDGHKYIAITGYTGTETSITFPTSLTISGEEIPVTAAYFENSYADTLKTIILPSSMTTIGRGAFSQIAWRTQIFIPTSVVVMGYDCFTSALLLISDTSAPASWDTDWNKSENYAIFGVTSTGVTSQGFGYAVSAIGGVKTVTITSYTGTDTEISIPFNLVNSGAIVSVTAIAPYAFNNTAITSVTIPNNITSIGEGAFYNCHKLVSVSLPNKLTNIENSVFGGCEKLTDITLPSSVTSIGENAFTCCSSLIIMVSSKVTTIGRSAFFACKCVCTSLSAPAAGWNSNWCSSSKILYNVIATGTLSNGITYAIYLNEKSENVAFLLGYSGTSASLVIPSSITYGGSSVTVIGMTDHMFEGCTTLVSVTIPDSFTEISDYAFSGCSSLTTINIPTSCVVIGEGAFYRCSLLGTLIIPASVTTIKALAFNSSYSLILYIPNTVTTIQDGALSSSYVFVQATSKPDGWLDTYTSYLGGVTYGCQGLVKTSDGYIFVILDDGEGALVASLFRYTGSEAKITTPSSVIFNGETIAVTSLFQRAFSDSSLISIIISSSITSIGSYAFSGCRSLLYVYIPSSVTSIGAYATRYCSMIICAEASSAPEGWVSNWNEAACQVYYGVTSTYEDSNGLVYSLIVDGDSYNAVVLSYAGTATSITIPSNVVVGIQSYHVTSILNRAFYGCTTLTSITISSGVTSIGSYAFSNCSNLTSLTLPHTLVSISTYAFYNCSSLLTLFIPSSVTDMQSNAIQGLNFYSARIYCEATSQPATWSSTWNSNSYTVYWGYVGQGVTDSGYAFVIVQDSDSNQTAILSGYFGSSTSLVLPTQVTYQSTSIKVTTVGQFFLCQNATITSVTISSGIITIEIGAFYSCSALASVSIANTVTSIGMAGFINCTALTTLIIPSSVLTIGQSVFYQCTSLNVYCEASEAPTGWNAQWSVSLAHVYWYSETSNTDGDHWHYDASSQPVIWTD